MDPVRIGWLGAALDGPGGGYDRIHRPAFDEALESGILNRPYESVLHAENGLPHGSAKNATDGFKNLVDEGCIAVAGAYSSDNAMVVGPYAKPRSRPSARHRRTGLAARFHERYVARHGDDPPMWPNAIPVLAFDTARVLVEALYRAPVLTGWGVKAGFEQIRFMPSATGGPQTHIAGGPYDHQLFKGDWLLYGRVRNGELEFEGLFEPWE